MRLIAVGQVAVGLFFFLGQLGVGATGVGQLAIGGLVRGQLPLGGDGAKFFARMNRDIKALLSFWGT